MYFAIFQVYRHFLSAHTSEACKPDADFTPRRLHLIPLVKRIKYEEVGFEIPLRHLTSEYALMLVYDLSGIM